MMKQEIIITIINIINKNNTNNRYNFSFLIIKQNFISNLFLIRINHDPFSYVYELSINLW